LGDDFKIFFGGVETVAFFDFGLIAMIATVKKVVKNALGGRVEPGNPIGVKKKLPLGRVDASNQTVGETTAALSGGEKNFVGKFVAGIVGEFEKFDDLKIVGVGR